MRADPRMPSITYCARCGALDPDLRHQCARVPGPVNARESSVPITLAIASAGARVLIAASRVAARVEPYERAVREFMGRVHDSAMLAAVGLDTQGSGDDV